MKIAKCMKKATAALLTAAMVATACPLSDIVTLADGEKVSDVNFDENNVVLRLGIVSDLHLSYSADSLATIKNKVQNYSDTVATLEALAKEDDGSAGLDALLLGGDYTSTGNAIQGETFASASKAIMDAINADKSEAEKTKFIMTYGNHDTEWTGQMDYAGWESLLNQYGLLGDVTKGPEDSGCYSATAVKNGKTYYFFSVETEKYNAPSNMFRADVLEWLDAGLAAATTDNPNSYVYVISHGPIKETGVYGSDMEYDKNADWGTAEDGYTGTVTRDGEGGATYNTSSNLNAVLKKYPQVMYFSGHTHFTDALESSIMSKEYTAVNIAALTRGDLYNNASNYLDGIYGDVIKGLTVPGEALYLEVDVNGNQRIQRIVAPYNFTDTIITYSEEKSGVENPSNANGEPATINGVVVGSVTLGTVNAVTTDLADWVMAAPNNAEKTHLTKYSADERRAIPVFSEGAKVTVSNDVVGGTTLTADVTFDAATCSNNIIRYEISLVNPAGEPCATRWALGNWTDTTVGVNEGTTHKDATSFKYTGVQLQNAGAESGYKIRVTAVDEFGGRAYIESDVITPTQSLEEPKQLIYENMFVTDLERVVGKTGTTGVTFTQESDGSITTVLDGTATEKSQSAFYMTSESKYHATVTNTETKAPFNGNAYSGSNPSVFTDFSAEDTFVYEADFAASNTTTGVYFHIRTPEMNTGADSNTTNTTIAAWRTEYTGIYISANNIYLSMCGATHSLGGFKLDDTDTHHIKVASSPEHISIWVDGAVICENKPFNPTAWENDTVNSVSLKGRFKSDKMIPTMGIHVTKTSKVTVKNQKLYYYNPAQETEKYVAADELYESNMFDGITSDRVFALSHTELVTNTIDSDGVVTTTANIADATTSKYTNLCYVTSSEKFAEKGSSIYEGWASPGGANAQYFTDLDVTDTYIYEADFKSTGAKNSIYFHIRTPDLVFDSNLASSKTDYTGVRVATNGVSLKIADQVVSDVNTAFKLEADDTYHHIRIESTPTKISVTIDGIELFKNAEFNKAICIEKGLLEANFKSSDMIPTMAVYVHDVNLVLTNQSLRKVTEVTPYTTNLLNTEYGTLYTNNTAFTGSVTVGNNFYSDVRYTSLPSTANRYLQDKVFFFDNNNVNYVPEKQASYVLSGLMTAMNATLKDTDKNQSYSSRMYINLGKYNGENAFAFVGDSKFYFYIGSVKHHEINLATEYDYQIGDTVRLTTLLSPFGFEMYYDGIKMYEYTYDNPNLIDYTGVCFGISGTLGAWRDMVMYENTANGVRYAENLAAKAENVSRIKGVYFTEEDRTAAAEVATACRNFSGTENTSLKQYVGVVDSVVANAKIVNNMVLEGLTATPATQDYTFDPVNGDTTHHIIPLFNTGACPITGEDAWIVEFDLNIYSVGSSNVRMAFAPYGDSQTINNSAGIIMIQDNGVLYDSDDSSTAITWTNATSENVCDEKKSIKTAGSSWHFTYRVTPKEENQVEISTVVTSLDGNTKYFDFAHTYTGITTIAPHLYYRTANIGVSNLCISYDLTEDFAALNSAYTRVVTTDIAKACVDVYNEAKTVGETIYANQEQYGRGEIREATTNINAAVANFEIRGNVNRDEEDLIDVCDLVRMKKILKNPEEKTITADVNEDGVVDIEDLKTLIKRYLLGIVE